MSDDLIAFLRARFTEEYERAPSTWSPGVPREYLVNAADLPGLLDADNEDMLRRLAADYSDHPDYRADWAP